MIMLEDITTAVARRARLTPADLRGRSRVQNVATARQACYWIARHLTPRSFPQIGAYYGDRDHTTVVDGVQVFTRKLAGNDTLARMVRLASRDAEEMARRRENGVAVFFRAGVMTFRTRRDKALAEKWGVAA